MENSNVVKIERPAYNYTKFKDEFEVKDVAVKGKTVRSCLNECVEKRPKPSKKYMKEQLFRRLPFLNIIRIYRLKFLLRDVLSGLTVGVIQIAPTMANSTTANLPPINGLYVAFFSVIAYLLFGTSRHLSMGTHGVISIMVGNTIKNYEGILYPDKSNSSSDNYLSDNPTEAKILIAMTLAFIVGIIQLFLGLINAGFISKYMSDTMIEAFTIGSSYLIVVSQIGALLGIEVHRLKLPFKLIDNLIGIFADILSTNWATVIISVISITSIYLVKKYINDRYKKKLPAPIPIELIVVIIATLLAHFFQFGTRYNVGLVGPVPLGIPSPRLPPIRIFSTLFFSSFSIALVSFALNISMAKFFATKFNYPLDINQDLFAYGVGNILSGVFSGLPAAGGLTRTLIVETSGAKSQVYSLVSSVFVLVVILGLGSLFKELPECCLAAIIVTALIHKCFEVTKFFKLFKKSKAEAIVWLSTFAGVMILDVDYGLYIGLAVSVLTIVAKNQLATASVLGNIPETEFFEPISTNSKAKEIERVKIIRYEDSIYYVNAENFLDCVVKLIGVEKPIELLEELHLIESEYNNRTDKQIQINFELNTIDKDMLKRDLISKRGNLIDKLMLDHVVLDMSSVNFIDSMGVNQLDKLNKLLRKLEISLHLTHVKSPVFKVMTRFGLVNSFDLEHIYPTNSDALVFIRNFSRADETSNSSTIISHIV